jgi:hypothetical protein
MQNLEWDSWAACLKNVVFQLDVQFSVNSMAGHLFNSFIQFQISFVIQTGIA